MCVVCVCVSVHMVISFWHKLLYQTRSQFISHFRSMEKALSVLNSCFLFGNIGLCNRITTHFSWNRILEGYFRFRGNVIFSWYLCFLFFVKLCSEWILCKTVNCKDNSAHTICLVSGVQNQTFVCSILKQKSWKADMYYSSITSLEFSLKEQSTNITFSVSMFYLFTWGKWTQKQASTSQYLAILQTRHSFE